MYTMIGWPRWLRGVLNGAVFVAASGITALATGQAWGEAAAVGLVGGITFAIFSTRAAARVERDMNPADGPGLRADERAEAYRAAGQGRPSTNPRVQAAAVMLARRVVA